MGKQIFVLLLSVLLAVGCSKKKTTAPKAPTSAAQPKPEVQAPPAANDNYVGQGTLLVIKKAALEKEHLLRTQLVEQVPTHLFNGLKSRIVAFRLIGEKVYMLEAAQGHIVSKEVKPELILTSFPVVKEAADGVTIDFNAGMKKLFYVSDWEFEDFQGTFKNKYTPIGESYIKSIETTASNTLYIQQQATMSVAAPGGLISLEQAEIRYYLTPYNPASDYVPLEAPSDDKDMLRHGFFTISTVLSDAGTEKVYASRFHPKKKIVFAISPNTPADFKQAVKDGVLYWNAAFGDDVIAVVDAPANGPLPDYNVVQWLDWDAAGFARADAQMDPRTGEILNAQVMMTSVFGTLGKQRAIRFRKERGLTQSQIEFLESVPEKSRQKLGIDIENLKREKTSGLRLRLEGFETETTSPHCNHPMDAQLELAGDSIAELMAAGKEDVALKVAQDYVREVVAHEIGHTLGLRHNFAGSLSTDYKLADRDRLIKEYLSTGKAPQMVPSNSVMEYQRFEESGITGDQIANLKQALPYDYHVIRKLYLGIEFPNDPEQKLLFCTDRHVGVFIDCDRFDLGESPLEMAKYELAEAARKLPYDFIHQFIDAKAPSYDLPAKELKDVVIEPNKIALKLLEPLGKLNRALTTKGQLLKVFRKYAPAEIAVKKSAILQDQFEYLAQQAADLGGLEQIVGPIDIDIIAGAKADLGQFLEVFDKYSSGTAPNGKKYAFTEKDLEYLKGYLPNLFVQLNIYKIAYRLQHMGLQKELMSDTAKTQLNAQLKEYLMKASSQSILGIDGWKDLGEKEVLLKDGHKVKAKLKYPDFKLPFALKLMAANLLARDRDLGGWGEQARLEIMLGLEQMVKESFGGIDANQIRRGSLPEEAIDWLDEFDELKKILAPAELVVAGQQALRAKDRLN